MNNKNLWFLHTFQSLKTFSLKFWVRIVCKSIISSSTEYERQCRKAERMWRKTKLEIHYSIYKDSLHASNVKLTTARQTFFSNLINSNLNNTYTLFATVERLTNPPIRFPVKCSPTANAMRLLLSFLRRLIISERWLAHPQVMQRSDRFDCNFKNKLLCLFLKQLIAKFWKK